MIKKTITYEDFAGDTHTEDFYFHMSKAELLELELGHMGGETFTEILEKISTTQDGKKIFEAFKDIVRRSIGERSADGRSFRKDPDFAENFLTSEAYSEMFIEFMNNANTFADFVNGLVPASMREQVAAATAERLRGVEQPETQNVFEQSASETGPSDVPLTRRELRD